eukprot:38846-Pyramimonas_sp.AAC.1
MQQEAQGTGDHERAMRCDLERQKPTREQKLQDAHCMLDATRAETAPQTCFVSTSEEAARQQGQSEQLHRECERLQLEGQRIERMNQDLRLEEQAAQVMAAQDMQRKAASPRRSLKPKQT